MTLPFSTCIRLTVSFLLRYEISSPLPSATGNNSGFSLTSERSRLWIHPCGMLPVSVSQILTVFIRQSTHTRSRRNIFMLLGGGLRSVKESRDTVFLHSACVINKERGDTVSRAHLLKYIGELLNEFQRRHAALSYHSFASLFRLIVNTSPRRDRIEKHVKKKKSTSSLINAGRLFLASVWWQPV